MSWCPIKFSAEVETTPTANTKTRDNTRHNRATSKIITILVLWVMLIFSQLVPAYSSPSSRVLSRKALFLQTVPFHAAPTPAPPPLEAVYSEDKRRIHTASSNDSEICQFYTANVSLRRSFANYVNSRTKRCTMFRGCITCNYSLV